MRDPDIDHQHIGHELHLCGERRQRRAIAGQGRNARGKLHIAQCFRCDQRLPGLRHERLQARAPDRWCIADLGRQGDGLDTEQAIEVSVDLNAAFQHRWNKELLTCFREVLDRNPEAQVVINAALMLPSWGANGKEEVADYLAARAPYRSIPFRASRFVLFSSRASVGGGPYLVEAAYALERAA